MTSERLLELVLGNLGTLVLLLLIIVGGARGWWVYGRFYDKLLADNAELRVRLERVTKTGERLAGTIERLTSVAERRRRTVGDGE